jgi:hypothetical protein
MSLDLPSSIVSRPTDVPAPDMSDKSSLDKEHGSVGSAFKGLGDVFPRFIERY